MSSAISSTDLLDTYKRRPFAEGLIPFQAALNALDSPWPRIYPKKEGQDRWVFFDKKTKEPALFSYAAMVASSDDEYTGNYVPAGEEVPFGVELKTVQRRANTKCFYTYIFDTYEDKSLFEGQWILDDYMRQVKDFNPTDLPRRSYLSGDDVKFRGRFWMQTPMFLKRDPNEAREDPATHLHYWVKRADQQSKIFRANPDRPRLWIKVGDEILPISERRPCIIQKGDITAISFTVTYFKMTANWYAQFHPADIVVLKDGDGDGTDFRAPALALHSRPPPSFDASLAQGNAVNCQYIDPVEEKVDPVTHGTAMEGVWREVDEEDAHEGRAESMEVDEGIDAGSELRGSTSPLSASGSLTEAYELTESDGASTQGSSDEFVDLVAEEEGRRGRGAGVKARKSRGRRRG